MKKLLSLLLLFCFAVADDLYLSYENSPQEVYVDETFEMVIKATIFSKDYHNIKTTFSGQKNINILNKNSLWIKKGENIFMNSYIVNIDKKEFVMPQITVDLLDTHGELLDTQTIQEFAVNIKTIEIKEKTYSQVVADSMRLLGHKTKQYDNNQLHTIIKLEAINSNIEKFHLQNFNSQQGINDITKKDGKAVIYYDIFSSIDTKQIKFSYFNTQEKKLKFIKLDIKLEEDLVSTQTDLNPQKSNFHLYRIVALLFVIAVLVGLYFLYKKRFIFIVIGLVAIVIIYLLFPNKTVLLKAGKNVYIQPLKRSTVFKKTKNKQKVAVLKTQNGFMKVMFEDKTIGWVKDEK